MVAIFSGNSLGLNLGSLATLGRSWGLATQGRNGERSYVNVATGDLVLQDLDASLAGLGRSATTLRTYNSLGGYDFDAADGWTVAPYRAIQNLGNGTLRRYDVDGSTCDYAFDATRNLYVATVAAGSALDTIAINADGTYTWTDGATGSRETYKSGSFGLVTSWIDTRGNSLAFSYDANNMLSQVRNSDGETVTYGYGGAGGKNLLSVTTTLKSGQVLSQVAYGYDVQNRLQTVSVALNADGTVPAGTESLTTYTTTYGYDGTSNRVASITQSDGTTLGFTYVLADGAYKLATVTDGTGQVTRFAYDSVARTTTVTDPLGVSTAFQYDAKGELTQVRTGVTASNTTGLARMDYAYDALGNVKTITDGQGHTVTMQYDTAGNLTSQVDALGNTLVRTYDARNQVQTETVYAGAGQTQPEITRYVYDAGNRNLLRFVLTGEGRVTEYRYNALGLRTTTVQYAAAAYDVSGLAPTAVPTEAQMATWAAAQDLTRTQRTDLAYDFRGQLQTATTWGQVDATGNGVAGTGEATQYVYDYRGALLQTVTPDTKGITQTIYDGLGRVVTTVARSADGTLNTTTVTGYDDANRKTTVTLANGLATVSVYDAAGRLVSVTQSSSGTTLGTTRYWYDADGRLLMTQDPTGQRTWILYDASGRKVGAVDASGGLTEYVYDANDRVTEVIGYATAISTAALVDASGNPTTAWNANPGAATGTPVTQASIRPTATAQDTRSWTLYDDVGRVAWQVDALGYVTQTQYDGASRIVSVTRLATPIDVSRLGNGIGVNFAVAGYATTTALTETTIGTGPSAQHVLTATVSSNGGANPPASMTGTVTFFSGTTCLGTAALANGAATMTVGLPVGTSTVTAVYSGDANNLGSASNALTDVVAALATTTTTLQVSRSSTAAGAPVTLLATVSGASPTGNVTFYNGATALGTVALMNGTATLVVTTLPVGAGNLSASYAGDAGNAASTSTTVAERILTSSTTTLTASTTSTTVGAPVTLTATVTGSAPGGTVSFFSGSTLLGSATVSAGVAPLVVKNPAVGTLAYTAVYSGDAGNTSSTSAAVTETVAIAPTTTTLTTSTAQTGYGSAVTLTAAVSGTGSPAGTVTFYNGATALGTGTLANGQASLTVSALPVGTDGLTATYAGNATNATSTSASVSEVVAKAAPTTTLTSSAPTSAQGAAVTFTATVAGPAGTSPTGTVTFLDGNTVLGTASLSAGRATLAVASLSVGSHSIRVGYAGDGSFVGGVGAVVQTVTTAAPSVTLTCSPTSAAQTTPVVLTARVTSGATALPTGTVYFYNGATYLGAATLADGVAALTLSKLPTGIPSFTARYLGDASNAAATSAAVAPVTAAVTSTTLAASVVAGSGLMGAFTRTISMTATVAGNAPTGKITFFNGQTVLGTATISNGVATLTGVPAPNGTWTLTAAYSGDSANASSISAGAVVTVSATIAGSWPTFSQPATSTTLGVSPTTSTCGQAVTLTAIVNGGTAGYARTAPVSFFSGTMFLGCAIPVNGTATLTVSSLPAGTATTLTAVYAGDAWSAPSTAAASETVYKATPSVTLYTSATQITPSIALTLVAKVAGPLPPSGTVTFYNGATALGSATIANGLASLTVTTLPAGTASLTATYGGDANLNAVTSSATAVAVVTPKPASSTTLSLSTATSARGTPVTLTATVTGASPAGTVSFFFGSTLLGSANLSAGVASLTVTSLPVGADGLTAAYSGDAANASSTSAVVLETVQVAPTTTALNVSTAKSTYGGAVTLTATVTGTGNPTGRVQFSCGSTVLGTSTLVNGQATLSISNLPPGTDSLTATYLGDASNATSTSAAATEIVAPTVVLTSSAPTAAKGAPVTLTATVPAGIGSASPTGTVTFLNGTTVLGTAALAGGSATLTVTGLPLGTSTITAWYSGGAYGDAVGTTTQVVNLAPTTVALTSSPIGGAQGTVLLTATVSGSPTNLPTGTVSFYDAGTLLNTVTLSGGVAALTVTSLPTGVRSLTATYSGDASNAAGASPTPAQALAITSVSLSSSVGTVTQGAAFKLTATVAGSAPGGMVTFLSGQSVIGTATVNDGVATLTTARLYATGTANILATYSGDNGNASSVSAAVAVTVTAATFTAPPAPPATYLTLTPSSTTVAAGTALTLTANVGSLTNGTPSLTGTICFFNGATLVGSDVVVDGAARLTLSNLPASATSLVAVYSGDAANASSTSAGTAVTVTVTARASTTSLLAPPVDPVAGVRLASPGTPTTLVAQVSGGLPPGGTVSFYNGATLLGTSSVVNGLATLSVTLPAGTLGIKATYNGDANNAASTSAVTTFKVAAPAASATALSLSTASSTYGAAVTLTATVTGSSPSGTVSFFNGSTYLGSAVVGGGVATLGVNSLTVGADGIRAVYSGDGANAGSSSSVVTETVSLGVTSTTLSTSTAQAAYGAAVTLTALVFRYASGGAGTPSGTVTFYNGSTILGSAPVVGALATLTVSNLPVGANVLKAVYNGDPLNAGMTSPTVTETIVAAATSLTVTSQPSIPSNGNLTVRVTGVNPTGTVTFLSGTTVLGTATFVNGVATLSGAALPMGTTTLSATYSGDAGNASCVLQFSQTVTKTTTTTALTPGVAGSIAQGTPLVLTARVGGQNPTGTVTFYDGATVLGTASLVNGVAAMTAAALSTGAHSLTASYAGDASNASSTSATVSETVVPARATVSLSTSAGSVAQGSALTLTASVTGTTPTGQVTFTSGSSVLGTAALVNGVATLTIAKVSLPAGSTTIVAAYAGDAKNGAAVSAGVAETVTAGTPTLQVGQDPTDRAATRIFDRSGLLRATIDAEGYLTEVRYDAAGRAVQTIAHATKVTGFTNAASIAARVAAARSSDRLDLPGTDGLLPASSPDDVTTFTYYDDRGRIVGQAAGGSPDVTDPNKVPRWYLTETLYDANGHVWKTIAYASPTANIPTATSTLATLRPLPSALDRENQVTESTWDALGRLSTRKNAEGTITSYAYDAVGQLVATTIALNTDDQRTLRTRYDVQGRVTAELSGVGAAELAKLGASPTQAQIDAIWAQYATTHAYDAAGRRISSTDAAGNKTVYLYDEVGRLRFAIDALGEISESRYDALGHVTSTSRFATALSPANVTALQGGVLSSPANQTAAAAIEAARSASTKNTVSRFLYDADGDVVQTSVDGTLRKTTSTYDAFGEVVSATQFIDATRTVTATSRYDRRGIATQIVADAGSAPTNVNATRKAEYDAFGRCTKEIDANGNALTRTFDRLGRVVQTVEPSGTRFATYDAFGRVLSKIDARGYTTTFTYDTANRSVVVLTPEGVKTTAVHNREGQTFTVTDGNLNVTTCTYDANGALLSVSTAMDPADPTKVVVTSNAYDNAGRLWRTTDANKNVVEYKYDAANRVLSRTVDPDAGGLQLKTSYQYDAKGQRLRVTDPNGIITRYDYDLVGEVLTETVDTERYAPGTTVDIGLNLATSYAYDALGNVLTVTSPSGASTQYVYDGLGRRTQTTVDVGTGRLNLTTTYAYDRNGNVVTVTDANRNVTRNVYDAANRLQYTIDDAGDVRQMTYDAEGHVTATTTYSTAISLAGLPAAPTASDVSTRLQAAQTGLPNAVQYSVYDKDGRLKFAVNGAGGVTKLEYDGNGNVVRRTEFAKAIVLGGWTPGTDPTVTAAASGDPTQDVQVRIVYDALNRAIYTIDGRGAVVAQTYDGNGNVVDRVAYARCVLAGAIPDVAALTKKQVDDAVAAIKDPTYGLHDLHVRRTYDRANRLTCSVDGAGDVTQQVYDADGNLVKQIAYATPIVPGTDPTLVARQPGVDRVISMTYDGAGRLVFKVDALGSVTKQVYDRAGNVVQTTAYYTRVAAPTESTAPITAAPPTTSSDRSSYAYYDAANRMIYAVDATGAVVQNTYDGAGNLVATRAYATLLPYASSNPATSVTANAANDRITLQAFDAANRVVYRVDALGYVTKNVYDGIGRVSATTRYGAYVTGLAIGASADAIKDRIAANTAADRTDQYTYDAAGNVLTRVDALQQTESYTYWGTGTKKTFTNATRVATWSYDYDAAGRLVSETSPAVTLKLDPANGNLLPTWISVAGPVTRLEYDALGNVTKRTEASGLPEQRVTSYVYDALGRQVSTIFPAVSVFDSTADLNSLSRTDKPQPQTPTTTTVYDVFGEAVASQDVAGNWSYKAYDALGRVQYEVDALGYVTGYARNTFGDATALTRYAKTSGLVGLADKAPTAATVATKLSPSDAANRTITTSFDALGRAWVVLQPNVWCNSGNGAGRLTRAYTFNTFNAFGELVQQENYDGASGTSAITTHYLDRRGQEVATVDALGYLTTQTYDAAGNVTSRIEYANALPGWSPTGYATYDLSQRVLSQDDRVATWTYDLNDRKLTETHGDLGTALHPGIEAGVEYSTASDGTSVRSTLTTCFDYDALGNLTCTTDPLQSKTYTYYDALGRLEAVLGPPRTNAIDSTSVTPLTVFARDAFGNVLAATEFALGATSPNAASRWGATRAPDAAIAYDAYGGAIYPAADRITLSQYDGNGNAVQVTDAMGVAHYRSYDIAGRLAREWQGVTGGGVTQTLFTAYQYDELGHLKAVITPASSSVLEGGAIKTKTQAQVGTVTTAMHYNAFGEVYERGTFASAAPAYTETFEYDNAGRLWRTNSGDGVVKVFLYDALGRQTAQITSTGAGGADGRGVDLATYASAQAVDQAGNAGMRRTDTQLDLLGRAVKQTLPSRQDGTDPSAYRPVVYQTFDRWGNVLTRSDPRNAAWVTSFLYNWANQVVQQTQPHVASLDAYGGAIDVAPTTFFSYDALGRQVAVRDANGHVNRQGWDAAGDLIAEYHADTGVVRYGYDAFGDRVAMQEAEGAVTRYGFDRLGRNIGITSDRVGVFQTNRSFFALWAPVARVGTGDRSINTLFTYDEAGRKVRQVDGAGGTTSYTYDLRGNIVATTTPGSIGNAAAFDVNGRQIADRDANGSLATWTYDALGQLQKHVDVGGVETTYSHDRAGQLTEQWNNGGPAPTTTDLLGQVFTVGTPRAAQHLHYTYDTAGQLVQIRDDALDQTTRYAYNAAGQRILEQTTQAGTTYQDQLLAYDTLGRLAQIEGMDGVSVHFDYDKVGNRLRQTAAYTTEAQSTVTDYGPAIVGYDDYGGAIWGTGPIGTHVAYAQTAHTESLWYAYDEMNRQCLVDGSAFNGDRTSTGNINSAQGRVLTYDKNGNRTSEITWGTQVHYYQNPAGHWYIPDPYGDYGGGLVTAETYGVAPPTAPGTQNNQTVTGDYGSGQYTYTWLFDNPVELSTHAGPKQEFYTYDRMNRLATVSEAIYDASTWKALDQAQAIRVDTRLYDAASRLLESGTLGAIPTDYMNTLTAGEPEAIGANTRINEYDAAGRLTRQRTWKGDVPVYGTPGTTVSYVRPNVVLRQATNNATGALIYDGAGRPVYYQVAQGLGIIFRDSSGNPIPVLDTSGNKIPVTLVAGDVSGYDAAGNVLGYRVVQGGLQLDYDISQVKYEGYLTNKDIGHRSDNGTPGVTTSKYDANGNLVGLEDSTKPANNRTYVNDASGHVLFKNQQGHLIRELVVNGNVLAIYGDGTDPDKPKTDAGDPNYKVQGDFDLAYEPITGATYAGAASYTVSSGDTLSSIALAAYGDPSLWYLIANANGLSGDQDLHAGQTLVIPSTVAGLHNNSSTFKAYDPSRIVGDTTPNLPAPHRKHGCGLLNIILTVVIVVVAIVVTVYTAGAASAALAGLGSTMSTILGGAIGAAVGSVVSQGLSMAVGLQEDFSWKQVGLAALGGAVGGAMQAVQGVQFAQDLWGSMGNWALAGARAAVSSAATQGLAMLTGLQKDFSWSNVAMAAVGGTVGAAAAQGANWALGDVNFDELMGGDKLGKLTHDVIVGTTSGIASGVAVSAIRGGKMDMLRIATDAFGNALGNSLGEMVKPEMPRPPQFGDFKLRMDWDALGVPPPATSGDLQLQPPWGGSLGSDEELGQGANPSAQSEPERPVEERTSEEPAAATQAKKGEGALAIAARLAEQAGFDPTKDKYAVYDYLVKSGQLKYNASTQDYWASEGKTYYGPDSSTLSGDDLGAANAAGRGTVSVAGRFAEEQAAARAQAEAAAAQALPATANTESGHSHDDSRPCSILPELSREDLDALMTPTLHLDRFGGAKPPPDAPYMTATPQENMFKPEMTQADFAREYMLRTGYSPRVLDALTNDANPIAAFASVRWGRDIEALDWSMTPAAAGWGLAAAGAGAAAGNSEPVPRFDHNPEWIGNVGVPEDMLPGGNYGIEMGKRWGRMNEERNPGVDFIWNLENGQNGIDGQVDPEYANKVGWGEPHAEFKPNTGVRTMNDYQVQFDKWENRPENRNNPDFGVQVFTYDYEGNIYKGWVPPRFDSPPSPIFPAPFAEPRPR